MDLRGRHMAVQMKRNEARPRSASAARARAIAWVAWGSCVFYWVAITQLAAGRLAGRRGHRAADRVGRVRPPTVGGAAGHATESLGDRAG
jgi:hypothetical protein